MDIETQGLGAGSYPTPPEEKTKTLDITVRVEYTIKDLEVPEEWDWEQIREYVSDNMSECLEEAKIEEYEIE